MTQRMFLYFASSFLLALTLLSINQEKYVFAAFFALGTLIGLAGLLLHFILDAIRKEKQSSQVIERQ